MECEVPIEKLAHYSVRTTDLEASLRFYTEVLGFIEGFRPPFDFPGAWLYQGGDESTYGIVHLIGIDRKDPSGLIAYLGDKAAGSLEGSGAIDHLAFLAGGLSEMHLRLNGAGIQFRERTVPSLGLHQVFLEDPSQVTIELNFPAKEVAQLAEAKARE
jgi:catechol 2,3-dioxygenase-like lactoylglutathione lyase family enzyme